MRPFCKPEHALHMNVLLSQCPLEQYRLGGICPKEIRITTLHVACVQRCLCLQCTTAATRGGNGNHCSRMMWVSQNERYLQPVPLLHQLQRVFVEIMMYIIVFLTDHVNVPLQHVHQAWHAGIEKRSGIDNPCSYLIQDNR